MNQKNAVLKLTAIQLGIAAILETVRWIVSLLIEKATWSPDVQVARPSELDLGYFDLEYITFDITQELFSIHFFYGTSAVTTIVSLVILVIYIFISWVVARKFCKDKLIDARPSFPFIVFTDIGTLLLVNNLLFLLGNNGHIFDKLVS